MKRAIGSPTKAQQDYQDRARALGCIACRLRGNLYQGGHTEIHHRTTGDMHGQKQLGHDAAIALCSWHHRGTILAGHTQATMRDRFGPSYALHKRDFMLWLQDITGQRSTAGLQEYQDKLLSQQEAA